MLRLTCVALLCLVMGVYSQVPGFGKCPTVKTQEKLDLHKYLGYWYEIYVFPTHFEKGSCTRAHYSLKEDGHIEVYNRGIENGQEVKAIGDAYRPNDNEEAKLKVRFADNTPYGDYWVVHTDYDTYSLIYSCGSLAGLAHIEFAWILARNMTLDESTTQMLKNELASYNVDVSKFIMSNQTGCPP